MDIRAQFVSARCQASGQHKDAASIAETSKGSSPKSDLQRLTKRQLCVVTDVAATIAVLLSPVPTHAQTAARGTSIPPATLIATAAPAASRELSSLESSLVGTWKSADGYTDRLVRSFTYDIRPNGTYTLNAEINDPANSSTPQRLRDVVNQGRWGASQGLFVTVITGLGTSAAPVDLRHPANKGVYLIGSVDENEFIYQNAVDGSSYRLKRVARDLRKDAHDSGLRR